MWVGSGVGVGVLIGRGVAIGAGVLVDNGVDVGADVDVETVVSLGVEVAVANGWVAVGSIVPISISRVRLSSSRLCHLIFNDRSSSCHLTDFGGLGSNGGAALSSSRLLVLTLDNWSRRGYFTDFRRCNVSSTGGCHRYPNKQSTKYTYLEAAVHSLLLASSHLLSETEFHGLESLKVFDGVQVQRNAGTVVDGHRNARIGGLF